jgi:hypothetical protein
MTTETTPRDMDRAKRRGARGWLVKPVAPNHLIALAQRIVENRKPSSG